MLEYVCVGFSCQTSTGYYNSIFYRDVTQQVYYHCNNVTTHDIRETKTKTRKLLGVSIVSLN